MKLIKYTAAATLISGIASAQGLFDVNPNESLSESSPMTYTLGVNLGYDGNVNPTTFGPEDGSAYMSASLSANKVVRNEKTSWDFNASTGTTWNFDDDVANQSNYNVRLAVNLNHRLNERVRFVSRNFYNFGLDLGSFFGPVTARDEDEYIFFSTDNSIGYRWTERLGTYTGIGYSLLSYDDSSRDVTSVAVYNSFRYSLDEFTTLTASIRYTSSSFEVRGADNDTTSATVGFERQLNEVSSIGASVGAQFSDFTTPTFNLHYNYQLSSQLRARLFASYSQEDTDTVFPTSFGFPTGIYDEKTALRVGAALSYALNSKTSLTFGGTTMMSKYREGSAGLSDADWDMFTLYLSAGYSINQSLSMSASINYSTSDSDDLPDRDFDRTRYQVGLNYTF